MFVAGEEREKEITKDFKTTPVMFSKLAVEVLIDPETKIHQD